jgi:two-component system, chemotaxis family, protein-glutamate methylesterase/glutaminase
MPIAGDAERRRDLVVIGASAGGVETLRRVVGGFAPDLPAAVCIVLHVSPGSPSALAGILQRAGSLPCRPARDRDVLELGQILVAPPDHHLVIEDRHVRLTVAPPEKGHRPGIDVLFRSAAHACNDRVIGVVLSGTREDGTAGLTEIKAHGGAAVVQDPDDALYGGMPASALAHVAVDAVVPVDRVAAVVTAMVGSANPSEPDPAGRPKGKPGAIPSRAAS